MTTTQETLFDATTTIYKQIATLKRGLPIAESKARTQIDKITVRKDYNARIKALDVQYKAVYAAMMEEIQ